MFGDAFRNFSKMMLKNDLEEAHDRFFELFLWNYSKNSFNEFSMNSSKHTSGNYIKTPSGCSSYSFKSTNSCKNFWTSWREVPLPIPSEVSSKILSYMLFSNSSFLQGILQCCSGSSRYSLWNFAIDSFRNSNFLWK